MIELQIISLPFLVFWFPAKNDDISLSFLIYLGSLPRTMVIILCFSQDLIGYSDSWEFFFEKFFFSNPISNTLSSLPILRFVFGNEYLSYTERVVWSSARWDRLLIPQLTIQNNSFSSFGFPFSLKLLSFFMKETLVSLFS
jgi:hypothetical protein